MQQNCFLTSWFVSVYVLKNECQPKNDLDADGVLFFVSLTFRMNVLSPSQRAVEIQKANNLNKIDSRYLLMNVSLSLSRVM
jgi:hypothetical protein